MTQVQFLAQLNEYFVFTLENKNTISNKGWVVQYIKNI